MSDEQYFGPFWVGIKTRDFCGKRLPKRDHKPWIDDGVYGEIYWGDSAGNRELAQHLLDAADAYDALASEFNS